jgi:hypothetical protein
LATNVLLVLQFQRAASTADLQLRAVFAFRLHVGSVSDFHGERMVPDFFPLANEDVSETLKVALARVNVSVWSNAHVYHRRCAGFDT